MPISRLLKTAPILWLVLLVPPLAFAATLAITLAFDGGAKTVAPAAPAPLTLQVESSVKLATDGTDQTASVPPAADRSSCSEIEGTSYRSDTERDWYRANCPDRASSDSGGGAAAVASGGAPVASGGDSPTTGGGAAVNSVSGPATVGGGEYATGDRLIIPRIGLNAPVNGVKVPVSGDMSNPVGYFNAVWYDFANFPGMGGYTEGNVVLSGHVDSARYGLAIFWYVRDLQPGDTIQYVTSSGVVVNYVVVAARAYSANSDFSSLVATGAADLTLITCTGTFSSGSYDLRHVVHARKS